MRFFTHVSTRAKVILGAALVLAAVAVPTMATAVLGADRPTIVYAGPSTRGFDHVTFNSLTNVPNIGDERNFLHGMKTGTTAFTDPVSTVKSGDEVTVRVYVHNNADPVHVTGEAGIARNTRVRVELPTGLATTQVARAFVSADNAQPQIVEDHLTVTGDTAMALEYVPGSAAIKTNVQNKPLADAVVSSGVLVGTSDLNGNVGPGFDNQALVTFKVKVVSSNYYVMKKVKLNGAPTSTFADSINAKVGDKVDFMLTVKNSGVTDLNNVVIGDRLPSGLRYVAQSGEWYSIHTQNQWNRISPDDWMAGGVDIGNYVPGSTAFVRFTTEVIDQGLQCNANNVVNTAFTKPRDLAVVEDQATVVVNKVCAPTPTPPTPTPPTPPTPTPTPTPVPTPTPTPVVPVQAPAPVYACNVLRVSQGDNRTAKITAYELTSTEKATFKHAVINWGDGSANMTTNNVLGQSHQYAADGNYTIRASAHFTVDGKDVTTTSDNCITTVSFVSPTPLPAAPVTNPVSVVTPNALPNVGVGAFAPLFIIAAAIGTAAHHVLVSRRQSR